MTAPRFANLAFDDIDHSWFPFCTAPTVFEVGRGLHHFLSFYTGFSLIWPEVTGEANPVDHLYAEPSAIKLP